MVILIITFCPAPALRAFFPLEVEEPAWMSSYDNKKFRSRRIDIDGYEYEKRWKIFTNKNSLDFDNKEVDGWNNM